MMKNTCLDHGRWHCHAGVDVVFHCATMAPNAESTIAKAKAHAVNVVGTENVIKACQAQKVPKLVYTSSASVVFEGRDLNNVDESAPYAAKPLDYYTLTKVGTSMTCLVIWHLPAALTFLSTGHCCVAFAFQTKYRAGLLH